MKYLIKKILFHFFTIKEKYRYLLEDISGKAKLKYYSNLESKGRVNFGLNAHFDISGKSKVTIKNNFRSRNGLKLITRGTAQLSIGENVFMNANCSINCLERINIGNNVLFGENVLLYDHNHNYSDKSKLIGSQGYSTSEIKIGDNCWIGSNVVILKGAVIGHNTVIGAGVVVRGTVSDNSIIVAQQDQKNIAKG